MFVVPFDLYVCPLTPCSIYIQRETREKQMPHFMENCPGKIIMKAQLLTHEQKKSTKFVNAFVEFLFYVRCFSSTFVKPNFFNFKAMII